MPRIVSPIYQNKARQPPACPLQVVYRRAQDRSSFVGKGSYNGYVSLAVRLARSIRVRSKTLTCSHLARIDAETIAMKATEEKTEASSANLGAADAFHGQISLKR